MPRKRNQNKQTQYFAEKQMNQLIKEYKTTRNEKLFKQIAPSFSNIIDGMINKEFSYNYHIKNNREDAHSECMCQILKSLERYDPDKGRLYAYTNRIVKNTLLSMYKKKRRIADREYTYTDISRNLEDDMDNDKLCSITVNNSNEYVDDTTTDIANIIEDNEIFENGVIDIDSSINILYNYIKYLKDVIDYFLTDKVRLKNLVNNIPFDEDVDFEFINNKNSLTQIQKYKNILNNINDTLNNILKWMESTYKKKISKKPTEYTGNLSDRAIGYIRSFVQSHLKKCNICRLYDIEDIIKLLQYLIKKRYNING